MNQEQEHNQVSQPGQPDPKPEGFVKEVARDVGKEFVSETKVTLKWALGGAIVGALILGGVGAKYLGLAGLGWGALAGAVVGSIAGALIYITTLGNPFDN